MKNCGGDAETLRSQLRNIVEHYKVKFNNFMFNFNIQLLGDYTYDADLVTFANLHASPSLLREHLASTFSFVIILNEIIYYKMYFS